MDKGNFFNSGLTEQLLFAQNKYERIDVSFMTKISSLDYGSHHRVILVGTEKEIKDDVWYEIQSHVKRQFGIEFSMKWNGLIIFALPEKMIGIEKIKELYRFIEKRAGKIKMAGSAVKDHLEDCHIGLQEAVRTYDMIESMKIHKEDIMLYEDLGIYSLLYDLNEADVFRTFYNSVFHSIWKYDKENDGNLFKTLECYFKNNCDKEKTAEELFIHENTIRYRIKQIEEIMGCDLRDVNTITDIVTALKVRRMIQIIEDV